MIPTIKPTKATRAPQTARPTKDTRAPTPSPTIQPIDGWTTLKPTFSPTQSMSGWGIAQTTMASNGHHHHRRLLDEDIEYDNIEWDESYDDEIYDNDNDDDESEYISEDLFESDYDNK